jgi:hypothetical protein
MSSGRSPASWLQQSRIIVKSSKWKGNLLWDGKGTYYCNSNQWSLAPNLPLVLSWVGTLGSALMGNTVELSLFWVALYYERSSGGIPPPPHFGASRRSMMMDSRSELPVFRVKAKFLSDVIIDATIIMTLITTAPTPLRCVPALDDDGLAFTFACVDSQQQQYNSIIIVQLYHMLIVSSCSVRV